MRKHFPDEARVTASHDKPKKHVFATHDVAKNALSMLLSYNSIQGAPKNVC